MLYRGTTRAVRKTRQDEVQGELRGRVRREGVTVHPDGQRSLQLRQRLGGDLKGVRSC